MLELLASRAALEQFEAILGEALVSGDHNDVG